MKSAAFASFQSAAAPEARLGGERDDNDTLLLHPDAATILLAVMKQIQETCERDIQQGIVPDNSIVWQIEADARCALARAELK